MEPIKPHLVLVEPHGQVRNMVKAMLSPYNIIAFDADDAAKEHIMQNAGNINLVITHLGNPSLDRVPGLDVLALAREHDLPVSIMTGREDFTKGELREKGASAVLFKPHIFENELQQAVKRFSRKRSGE